MDVLQSSVLLGSETPRLWTPPLRNLTPETSRGFEASDFAEDVLGIALLPWQKWLLVHALELLVDGSFRFRTLVVLVARQNGKTTLVQIIALWRMFVDRAPLVIGTAQNLDVAEEAWQGAVEMTEGVPDLAAEVAHVDRTNGKKQLRLETGERYKVAAASRRGGRGLSGDLVVLDELREHQTYEAWAAVTKTTMARPLAQVVCLSNAGDARSVVLSDLRTRALATLGGAASNFDDGSLGLFEWSAPEGCALDDPNGWAQANPSLGYRISERAIRSALSTDPEPVFRTEVLCQWVDAVDPAVIDLAVWEEAADPASAMEDPVAFAVDVSPNRSQASIAAAGLRADGKYHVECVESRSTKPAAPDFAAMDDLSWIIPRLTELVGKCQSCGVVIDPGSAANALLTGLSEAKIEVLTPSLREVGQACGVFYDAVVADNVRHLGDPILTEALIGAKKRPLGDTWAWDRKKASVDVTPLVASTLALWGFTVKHATLVDITESVW